MYILKEFTFFFILYIIYILWTLQGFEFTLMVVGESGLGKELNIIYIDKNALKNINSFVYKKTWYVIYAYMYIYVSFGNSITLIRQHKGLRFEWDTMSIWNLLCFFFT